MSQEDHRLLRLDLEHRQKRIEAERLTLPAPPDVGRLSKRVEELQREGPSGTVILASAGLTAIVCIWLARNVPQYAFYLFWLVWPLLFFITSLVHRFSSSRLRTEEELKEVQAKLAPLKRKWEEEIRAARQAKLRDLDRTFEAQRSHLRAELERARRREDYWMKMDWKDFERECVSLLKSRGSKQS